MGRVSKRKGSIQGRDAASCTRGHYRTAVYARLSSDRGEKSQDSLSVQIEIAKKFAEEWNQKERRKIDILGCYCDLGRTGTNFNRPEFKRLLEDILAGRIDCVIVKDLSRFGRNYLEAGSYLEKLFPFLGVRFIAVADGYDSGLKKGENQQLETEIKNLVNDMYARDISLKARLYCQERKQEGSYTGGPPPYGYRTVWEGRIRRLVPDENTEKIVAFIYQQFIAKESYALAAAELNKKRINPPSQYQKRKKVFYTKEETAGGWNKSAVERVIKGEVYAKMPVLAKKGLYLQAQEVRKKIARGKKEGKG